MTPKPSSSGVASVSRQARTPFEIVTSGRGLPGRYVIYGPEGVGKTSLVARMPKPIFMQFRGETGLETLMDANELPPTPHFPGEISSWKECLDAIRWLTDEDHDYKTLGCDALDGAQDLCFEHVCRTMYDNDHAKFLNWQKGYDSSPPVFKEFMVALDNLRLKRDMAVCLIGHSKIAKRKNPSGEDWTYYGPSMHDKLWDVTARWADAVFFMNFETSVDGGKAEMGSGKVRTIYTELDACWIAKNRFGLDSNINAGKSSKEACANLAAALKAARGRKVEA